MFEFERIAATAQLATREVSFKKSHGFVSPNKIKDRHTLQLAGFKTCEGNEAWFNTFVDSAEFKEHFDTHRLIDWDDICPKIEPVFPTYH